MKLSLKHENEFNDLLKDYLDNPDVLKMKNYIAHGKITVYDHCVNVAKSAFVLALRLKVKVNFKVLLVGALLHDLYLYDWHDAKIKVPLFKMHGYTHPFTARDNAIRLFNIDENIQNVIASHMWPLTLRTIPSSKEAWLVCIADKKVALRETIFER